MLRTFVAVAVVLAALASGAGPARAQAALYLTQADIPTRLNEQGLRNFMRGHNARQINEQDDHRTWKFKAGTFFRSPPGDLECHLLFYDVEHGSRLFVTEMTVFLSNREETAFLQNVTLERPQFKPRNRYIVVLTVRRQEMASANFELVGRPVERSGVVEFSDEDTADPDQMTAQQQSAAAEAQRIAIAREQARQREYEEAMREQSADPGAGSGGGSEGGEEEYGELPETGEASSSSGGCASCSVARRTGRSPAFGLAFLTALGALALRPRRPR
ncbi:MAG: hypothetical protein HYY06_15295 [Deltaproteobacteria bacterium]|nr:hypothetical protein [Deltaproteobacteria bacterium]